MAVSEVSVLSSLPPASRAQPGSAREVAAEFDTMIWELMLRESGLLRPLTAEGSSETAMLGELFVQDFARQLAAQLDIGFGRLALAAAAETQNKGVEK